MAYVNFEGISNSDIRKVFGLEEKEKAKASRILISAVEGGYSSLNKFRGKFKGKIGQPYILYTKDVLVKEEVIHFPIYMAMFL